MVRMTKIVSFLFCVLTLVACSTTSNQVSSTDLLHHNFVLTQYDGQPINVKDMQLRLEFGENMFVSGSMCHTFSGFGSLENNVLKVAALSISDNQYSNTPQGKGTPVTSCKEPLYKELDSVIHKMLAEGVQVQMNKNVLELKSESHRLVYELRDWV